MYQKSEEPLDNPMDVDLVSKDMELNFSNKNEDDDELEIKREASGQSEMSKIDNEDDYDKGGEKLKFEEEKNFQIKNQ